MNGGGPGLGGNHSSLTPRAKAAEPDSTGAGDRAHAGTPCVTTGTGGGPRRKQQRVCSTTPPPPHMHTGDRWAAAGRSYSWGAELSPCSGSDVWRNKHLCRREGPRLGSRGTGSGSPVPGCLRPMPLLTAGPQTCLLQTSRPGSSRDSPGGARWNDNVPMAVWGCGCSMKQLRHRGL